MTTFAREWNAALALVLVAAAILLASGHTVAAAGALALAVLAVIARWIAMRRQNRSFYGQHKSAR
ncbi:MAG TPA: hypothetical protein VFR73_15475 [Hyphomicrobiaceae bacterium]|jgi:hypothetical protein|nr:hypothetical protein [Hyphomicrobiaceae bacterium]